MFLCCLFVIPCLTNKILCQNNTRLFSKTELEYIGSVFVKTQIVFNRMQRDYEISFKGHRAMNNSGNYDSDIDYRKSLFELTNELDTREYIHLVNNYDSCTLNNNKIYVLKYSKLLSYGGTKYILAFSETGAMYFMRGFYKCDFERLLKDKLAAIKDKEEFINILYLYLNTANYSEYGRTIINKENIGKYKEKHQEIEPLKAGKTVSGSYKAVFYTIENKESESQYDVFYNSFEITPNLKVKSNIKEITKR